MGGGGECSLAHTKEGNQVFQFLYYVNKQIWLKRGMADLVKG